MQNFVLTKMDACKSRDNRTIPPVRVILANVNSERENRLFHYVHILACGRNRRRREVRRGAEAGAEVGAAVGAEEGKGAFKPS